MVTEPRKPKWHRSYLEQILSYGNGHSKTTTVMLPKQLSNLRSHRKPPWPGFTLAHWPFHGGMIVLLEIVRIFEDTQGGKLIWRLVHGDARLGNGIQEPPVSPTDEPIVVLATARHMAVDERVGDPAEVMDPAIEILNNAQIILVSRFYQSLQHSCEILRQENGHATFQIMIGTCVRVYVIEHVVELVANGLAIVLKPFAHDPTNVFSTHVVILFRIPITLNDQVPNPKDVFIGSMVEHDEFGTKGLVEIIDNALTRTLSDVDVAARSDGVQLRVVGKRLLVVFRDHGHGVRTD